MRPPPDGAVWPTVTAHILFSLPLLLKEKNAYTTYTAYTCGSYLMPSIQVVIDPEFIVDHPHAHAAALI